MHRMAPSHRLPDYLKGDLEHCVAEIMETEFKSHRDMTLFREHLVFELQKAQQDDHDRVMRVEAAKRAEQRAQRESQRASLDEQAFNWVKKNGKPGMLIKVVGSRDGLGYREIIEIGVTPGTPFRSTMTCYQLDATGRRKQIVEITWNKFRGTIEFGKLIESRRQQKRHVTITTLQDLVTQQQESGTPTEESYDGNGIQMSKLSGTSRR